jgi:D-xylose transport system permease protein
MMKNMFKISARNKVFIGVFLILAILFHVQSDFIFFTPRNLSLMLRQGAILALVAAGVALLIIMAEIDLSIGSAVFLCGVVASKLIIAQNFPIIIVIVISVICGISMGAFQGFLVVGLGIPSFIATLAGLLAFRGIGLLWTNAATIGPLPDAFSALSEKFIPISISEIILFVTLFLILGLLFYRHFRFNFDHVGLIGEQLKEFKSSRNWSLVSKILRFTMLIAFLAWIVGGFQGIPVALIWVLVITGGLSILLSSFTYGRNCYLIGANKEAAEYAGIRVKRNIFIGFLIMGFFYGVVGVLMSARLGASTPGAGTFMELDAIAAAVIGGVSLRGGSGSPLGAVMGAFLLTMINNGMSVLNISSFTQQIIKALILIIALGIDSYVLQKKQRR